MLFKRLELSAPGKIILCGEHAVVYGKKALATAINIRTHLHATFDDQSSTFILNLADISESLGMTQQDFTTNLPIRYDQTLIEIADEVIKSAKANESKHSLAIRFMITAAGIQWLNIKGMNVKVLSDIPIGSGLGSSASFAVCIALFFLIVGKKIAATKIKLSESELDLVNQHAFCLEKIFHGKPSGIDNTVSTYGGYISFQSGEISRFESELNLLVLIVSSGMPKNTMEQVMKVKDLNEALPEAFVHIISAIESIVTRFEGCLKENSRSGLLEMITMNHWLLSSLSVSNNQLDRIVQIAKENGCSCKLTGGGGGGCCFAIVESSEKSMRLAGEMKQAGFESFPVVLGESGARIDQLLF